MKIENNVLLKCAPSEGIGEVIIPEGVKEIEAGAFKGCRALTKVVIPSSVVKFGWIGIFEGCTELTRVEFCASVSSVPYCCFKDCIKLKEICLPDSIKKIDSRAFEGCIELEEICLPDAVQSIESGAFKGCLSLKNINFPSSLSSIGSDAFEGNKSLTSIELPASVQIVGISAFANCSSLDEVKIFGKVAYLYPSTFVGCHSISKVYLRDFNPLFSLSAFADSPNLNYIIPLSESGEPQYSEAVVKSKVQDSISSELKYMAMLYHNFGMNVTQMKWVESQKNDKSFKEPIDSNWGDYKHKEQDLSKLMAFDWSKSEGIGLVLGYNNYRALDVDGVDTFLLRAMDGDDGFDKFINKFLRLLHLPEDYPWVIYSGSGTGFHIIFKSDDIGEDIDSISFEHNDTYGTGGGNNPRGIYEQDHFQRIELRWCDHLVLPPSLHASGKQYAFRNGISPVSVPQEVCLTDIDNLLNHFSGERKLQSFTWSIDGFGELEFDLVETRKIVSRHDSYLSPHDYSQMPINWLKHSKSDESKISLALRYLTGDGVNRDWGKVEELLGCSDSQDAVFNLLSLYSVGIIPCESVEFWDLFKSLDTNLYSEDLVERIKNNASIVIRDSKYIVFFDTETTGLPRNYELPPSYVENWPRLVQLSWVVTDENGHVVKTCDRIIKPNGFSIPLTASVVHGITTEQALKVGEDLSEVLAEFMRDIKAAKLLVGHNIGFDKSVIGAELYRAEDCGENLYEFLDSKNSVCTMKSTIDFCKIPDRLGRGYKYPKLQELYHKLFGKYFEDAHNALVDVKATKECYFELRRRGLIK